MDGEISFYMEGIVLVADCGTFLMDLRICSFLKKTVAFLEKAWYNRKMISCVCMPSDVKTLWNSRSRDVSAGKRMAQFKEERNR